VIDTTAEEVLPVPEGCALVRLDKETGEPHPREFDSEALDLGWSYFSGALSMYRLSQAVEKMVTERKPRGKAA
ncbi:MAG TPA: hypothetical protein VFV10_14290, partial [Gammaproteobacteria bacterium]|nr:hypothetical protein [Gammaproteobacteria bacterium]